MNPTHSQLLKQSLYAAPLVAGLVLSSLPLWAIAEQAPKSPKDIITTMPCKPGMPNCPPPKCPPDCLMEIDLSLTDASGKTQTSKGDVKTTQRQVAQFIDSSAMSAREKADAKRQMQKLVAAAGSGGTQAKKKPEVEISCQGGPTTAPTGGTGGTVTCGFKVKFGGGE